MLLKHAKPQSTKTNTSQRFLFILFELVAWIHSNNKKSIKYFKLSSHTVKAHYVCVQFTILHIHSVSLAKDRLLSLIIHHKSLLLRQLHLPTDLLNVKKVNITHGHEPKI